MTPEIEGSLRDDGGVGAVRLECRLGLSPAALWSMITDERHRSHWLGELTGDATPGGTMRAHFLASGWEGSIFVEICEPPRHLRVRTRSDDGDDGVMELTLLPDGDGTVLRFDDTGMPLDLVAAYGAGDQIHLEDLAAHIAGEPRCDARSRWAQLNPGYVELARALEQRN